MKNIPPDVLRMSLNYLNDPDLAAACMTDKNFARNVCNDTFWINKIHEKFNLSKDIIDYSKGNNTYWAYYLNLLEYDVTERDFLKRAIQMGRKDLVLLNLVSDTEGNYGNDDGRLNPYYGRIAAKNGDLEMLKFLETLSMNIYEPSIFRNAIREGHQEIVEYLLDNGEVAENDLNLLLNIAIKYGNVGTVKAVLDHAVIVSDESFHWAYHTKYRDRKKAILLLKKGKDTLSDEAILDALRNLDGFKDKKDRKKLAKILNKIREARGI